MVTIVVILLICSFITLLCFICAADNNGMSLREYFTGSDISKYWLDNIISLQTETKKQEERITRLEQQVFDFLKKIEEHQQKNLVDNLEYENTFADLEEKVKGAEMMVTIISDELLEDLNNGKTINLEIGPLGITLASEKWAKRMEELGNIKEETNETT